MGEYTEHLKNLRYEISPENDDYAEKLLSVARSFRSFDEALDTFLVQRGFDGEISNIDEKVEFIRQKFREASVSPLPRNLKKWFTEKKRPRDRGIAFQFCFAFRLDLQESEDFFRTVYLQRGFDCHSIKEAICYYAVGNGLSYKEMQELTAKAPKNDNRGKINFSDEVLFTESIIKEIDRMKTEEELLRFFRDNLEQFGYNNATAYHYITEIWDQISGEKGLAEKERGLLLEASANAAKKKRSVWDIYLQILGLYDFDDNDEDHTPLFVVSKERSLKLLLKDNELLHPLAEDSFPERQGLEAILRGEYKSSELVRKTMILLVFYRFWTKLAVDMNTSSYFADSMDNERCYAEINRYLVDSGYPTLYAGNPYDWIFLFAMQDEYPMETFRLFMRELYFIKEDVLREALKS